MEPSVRNAIARFDQVEDVSARYDFHMGSNFDNTLGAAAWVRTLKARNPGLGILPYFPLESGLLSGKYLPGRDFPADSRLAKWGAWAAGAFASPEKLDSVAKLVGLCERHGHSLLQLAMGWLAGQPAVSSVIAGVTTVAQLEQNVSAAAWRAPAGELAEIDKVCPPPEGGFPGPRR